MIARTFAAATIIPRAMRKLANASVTRAGRVTIARNHALKAATAWAAKRNVPILFMGIQRHVTMSAVITCAALATWVLRVSIRVRMVNMDCIAARIVHVKMVLNAIISVVLVNVRPVGWAPTAIFHALMALMARIVVKIVNAKIRRDAARMMDTVSVIWAGWERIAMTCAPKVSSVSIVWSSVRVHRHNLLAMQLMDVNVGKVLVEWIA